MLLYHVALLEEVGQFSEALSLLDTNAKARAIIDRTAVMERRGAIVPKTSYETLIGVIPQLDS
jgi:hypothetical protein